MKSKIKKIYISVFKRRHKKHKGHELILKHKKEIFANIRNTDSVIEIGSQRGAGSTLEIARLCAKNDLKFITVDIDKETSESAHKIVQSVNPSFKAVNKAGELFLSEFKNDVKLAYLDAFDIPGDWHSEENLKKYNDRGTTLNYENCWKMHYDCAVELVRLMKKDSYICFDDVNPVDENDDIIFDRVDKKHAKWSGKGKTAIPFLLENGFIIIDNIRAALLLQKVI